MQTRRIGVLEASAAGLGGNNFGAPFGIDEKATMAVVAAALDAGVTYFDTAENYGGGHSEEYLGRALGSHRDEVIICSKFGYGVPGGASAAYVAKAIDASLARLGTDYIDLYCLHWPHPDTPIGETLVAMNDLVTAGKVRELGCTTFSAAQLDAAATAALELGVRPFAALVDSYSLLDRSVEKELLPACERLGIHLVPYYPLAMGVLTGKYRRNETPTTGRLAVIAPTQSLFRSQADSFTTDAQFDRVERLDDYARAHGHSLLDIALSWLVANPLVGSVIAGATSPEQARSNAAAATAWALGPTELAEIEALLA
jgi:aryl-alcohol dehydrogenase-like predicted oxidoreductase